MFMIIISFSLDTTIFLSSLKGLYLRQTPIFKLLYFIPFNNISKIKTTEFVINYIDILSQKVVSQKALNCSASIS